MRRLAHADHHFGLRYAGASSPRSRGCTPYRPPGAAGVAAALLRAIEESAREAGRQRIVLETGGRNPEAIAFYAKQGYRRITNYGYYREYPDCVSFGLDL